MASFKFKPHVFIEHPTNVDVEDFDETTDSIAMSCDGENLYIYQVKREIIFDVHNIWVHNLALQQWRLILDNNLPHDNDLIIGAMFESNYLVICTKPESLYRTRSSSPHGRLFIYNLNTESGYVRETTGQIPTPSLAINLIRHGKYLYTVGTERDNKKFSDVYRLNLENDVWEVVYICRGLDANEPEGRLNRTLVYSNNMIYIFGGNGLYRAENGFQFFDISAFDLEECCWKIVQTHGDEHFLGHQHYPSRREEFGITSYTDPDSGEINVIISGGKEYDEDSVGGEINFSYVTLDDAWSLNLTSLQWTELERFSTVLPHYVGNHSMAITPAGKLLTFGGDVFDHDVDDSTRSATLHSTWLRIPKLTDICWEAIFHYCPNLTSMTSEEIYSLGIPLHLRNSRIN